VTPRFYIRLRRSVSLVESSEIDYYRTYPHFSVAYSSCVVSKFIRISSDPEEKTTTILGG